MVRARPLFLALDQGGHATRALAFDSQGQLIAKVEKRIATHHPDPNRVEHDPQSLIASVRQVCKHIAHQLGSRVAHLRSAGLATQRSTIVCWDRQTGKALSPVISWQDRRAASQIQRLATHAARVHKITGLVLSPHYGASKLAWCLSNLPTVRRAMRQHRLAAGPLASFILANLLSEKPLLADPVNASRTLLWDYRRRNWSRELLALFRIPEEVLPACVPNQHVFGHLPLGDRKIPLAVVTGDQSAALFAGGRPRSDSLYVNLGTGAFIQQLFGDKPLQVHGLLGSVLWQDKRRALYVVEGTVNGAGSALAWLCDRLGISEKQMLKNMPTWLADPPEPPLFMNGISGLGSPYWISDFRSGFIGHGSIGQRFSAVAESIVFLLYENLKSMRRMRRPMRRIVISGGLSQWNGLCQSLADLSGIPVQRPLFYEATARGLVYLLGAHPSTVTNATVFKPNKNSSLENRYQRWRVALAQALRS